MPPIVFSHGIAKGESVTETPDTSTRLNRLAPTILPSESEPCPLTSDVIAVTSSAEKCAERDKGKRNYRFGVRRVRLRFFVPLSTSRFAPTAISAAPTISKNNGTEHRHFALRFRNGSVIAAWLDIGQTVGRCLFACAERRGNVERNICGEYHKQYYADRSCKFSRNVCDSRIYCRCDKEECDRQSERAALDLSGANGYRYRSDERSVANYRADSISVGNLAVSGLTALVAETMTSGSVVPIETMVAPMSSSGR